MSYMILVNQISEHNEDTFTSTVSEAIFVKYIKIKIHSYGSKMERLIGTRKQN